MQLHWYWPQRCWSLAHVVLAPKMIHTQSPIHVTHVRTAHLPAICHRAVIIYTAKQRKVFAVCATMIWNSTPKLIIVCRTVSDAFVAHEMAIIPSRCRTHAVNLWNVGMVSIRCVSVRLDWCTMDVRRCADAIGRHRMAGAIVKYAAMTMWIDRCVHQLTIIR